MSYEVTGELFAKQDTQQVTEKFRKREFVIEVAGPYPEYIKFQLVNDKCALLDGLKKGQILKVSFNLKGKGSQNKQGETVYYNNLDAWKVEPEGSETTTQQLPPAKQKIAAITPVPPSEEPANTDDLPF